MTTLFHSSASSGRPGGVVLIALLLAGASVAAMIFAILAELGAVPLSYGSILLPNGLEQAGPIAFLIYSLVCGLLAIGLTKRFALARRLSILLAVAGIAFVVPAISSAVADGRMASIAREGLQIVVRVAVVYYLSQEPVKEWFAAAESN